MVDKVVEAPVLGWKFSTLSRIPESPFIGYGNSDYGIVDTARCLRGEELYPSFYFAAMGTPPVPEDHTEIAPDPRCTCGFYALKHKPDDVSSRIRSANVLLRVELYGLVVVDSRGYRGEKQRVLAAYGNRASVMPKCVKCERTAIWYNTKDDRPICSKHAVKSRYRFKELEVTAPDLGGVEWNWIQ